MSIDLRPLHVRALAAATEAIEASDAGQLDDPTACGDWDLGDLLNHVVGQNNGFALAVETGDAAVSDYAGPGRQRARDLWPASVRRLTAAFAVADLDAQVRLVEISPDLRFPVGVALGFQLLDTVVHTWDVAASFGQYHRPDDDLVAATYAVARRVPGGDSRTQPGAAFGPELAISSTGDQWADTLALLGRVPR